MRTKWSALLIAAFAVLTLSGCGSNGGSGGSDVNDSGSVETVGIVNCSKCHSLTSPEAQNWLASTHGNPNMSPGGPHDETSSCQPCHNQLLDGENLPAAYLGEEARSIVSCESCHGGGSAHRGVGPLPYPEPTYEQCSGCHEYHGLTVDSDFETSAHLNSINSAIWADDTETAAKATCAKCHTDEGARKFKTTNGDRDQLKAALDTENPIEAPSVVQCRTCHTPHEEDSLLFEEDGVFTGSAEYGTCLSCHQLTYPSADETNPEGWMAEATYHTTSYSRTIADTHFDDPVTSGIEGYVVKNANNGACADCHNLHKNENTINNEWALSSHAGKISQAKQDAADNGRDVFTEPATPNGGAGRTGSCAVCHTSTGISSYLEDPDNYDSTTLDFSHLTGDQKELIYCWACHKNYVEGARNELTYGDLLNPGSLSLEDRNGLVMGTLPDIGNSNVCVKCHGGRGNQQTMIDDNNADRVHYLASAGTLYNEELHTGYEYSGLNYDKPSFFKHDLISLSEDIPETGSGPCFGCHMEEGAGHTFNVVTKDETTDNITSINTQAVCNECHSSLTADSLQTSSDGYQDALDLLQSNLVASPANNDELGATHNYNYLSAESGAYAHNSRYAKRLIFDALDYLDNGTLNSEITINTVLHPYAAAWYGADASGKASRP